ncbi:glycosyltransferase [Acinetobacter sp. DSM 11652]|uniref:glycosyltransferase n=1 Tax=Acinetobacter sp. DSM 11652 TaxID=346222 RepID=UPI0008CF53F3|nr:glycosyltransferase [Acinetobacter sp. DSM 11652]SEM10932.1 Glycosyltransferase involved in cell wall bisynthesis [Acinetobacter sp. DSM 11652]
MQARKKVLIVAPYVTFPDEPGANRFITIAKMLSQKHDVTLVTSRFCHILKSRRIRSKNLDGISVIFLDEPGYKLNVGFERLKSHHVFCRNFEKFILENHFKYDLVYSAYPLIKTNYILGKMKEKLNFKLVIDIQDIWPESIFGPMPFLSNNFGKLILFPISRYANQAYAYADALVAVSETYINRADVNQLDSKYKEVVYIGADSLHFNLKSDKLHREKIMATYIGTMAGSYDLETIVRASTICKDQVEIQFIGTGPHEERLKKLNSELGGYVNFRGTLPYDQAMMSLKCSDIAINPIVSTAQQSITNKLSDYFCCGLPILSCQENLEVKQLLASGGGVHYQSGNFKDLAQKLILLAEDRVKLSRMSNINKKIAQEFFLREKSYMKIICLVERLLR